MVHLAVVVMMMMMMMMICNVFDPLYQLKTALSLIQFPDAPHPPT
jgi:hypothetical protein